MKNLSIALNAILLVLVVILFVMFHNLKKDIGGGQEGNTPAATTGNNNPLRIAFVNADSINANYLLMRDFNNEIQEKEDQLQEVYSVKAKKLQDEYQSYVEKKQSGNISEVDDQRTQKDLQAKKNELDAMQQQRDELLKEVQDRNFQLQKKIERFIANYNTKAHFDYILGYENVGGSLLYGNESFDITKPIVNGLNQEYKDSLQKASPATNH